MGEGPAPSLKTATDKYLASRRLLQESGEITLHHLGAIEWTLTDLSTTIGPAKTVKGLGSEDYGAWWRPPCEDEWPRGNARVYCPRPGFPELVCAGRHPYRDTPL